MSEGICQIELQSLSNNHQDQVFSYSTEVSAFIAFGPCCAETFTDKTRKEEEREKGLPPQAVQTLSPGTAPPFENLTRLLWGPQALSSQTATSQDLANSQGRPKHTHLGSCFRRFLALPPQLYDHFQRLSVTWGRGPPCNLSCCRSQVRRGHLTTGALPPRARASLDRHGNRPPPRVTPARGAPLGSRQQVPHAARGLQPLPGLAAPRPARLRPARPHSLDPGAHGPRASSWARGPRSALRCPPARGRPASLRRSPRPFLPSLRLGPPARGSLPRRRRLPGLMYSLQPGERHGRRRACPARVRPRRLSHRRPLPPAPPPPAGPAGKCSPLAGGWAA